MKSLLKKLSLLGILFSFSSQAIDIGIASLKFGPKFGLNHGQYMIDSSSAVVPDEEFITGYSFGASARLDIPMLTFETGLLYADRGFKFRGILNAEASWKEWEVPLMVFFKTSVGVAALRMGGGASFNFGTGDVDSNGVDRSFEAAGIEKSSTDLLLGVGLDINIPAFPDMTVDLRGGYGLTDRSTASNTELKALYFDLLFGMYF